MGVGRLPRTNKRYLAACSRAALAPAESGPGAPLCTTRGRSFRRRRRPIGLQGRADVLVLLRGAETRLAALGAAASDPSLKSWV